MYLKIQRNGGQTYYDGWNLDLVKLYFTTGFRNPIKKADSNDPESQEDKMKRMSNYMICTHLDWKEGEPYEEWFYYDGYTGGSKSFNCYNKQITKPEVSLEKIEGKVSYFTNYSIRREGVRFSF